MNSLKIGLFDSGIGGFSILKEVMKLIPYAEFYYIADDEFAPYGHKSIDEIIKRSKQNSDLLLKMGVNLIVVACNTATAAAIEVLRNDYLIPFVGVEPYINVLNHLNLPNDKVTKCAVITTELTGRSAKFIELKKRLDPTNFIDHYMLKNLATLIERIYQEERSEELIRMIQKELDVVGKCRYDYLILGCTHYPLIKTFIENYLCVKAICPGIGVAKQAQKVSASLQAEFDQSMNYQTINFFQSTLGKWLNLEIDKIQELL